MTKAKKKMIPDYETIKKLAFPKDGSKKLNMPQIAKKFGCSTHDLAKVIGEFQSEHYDPISRKLY